MEIANNNKNESNWPGFIPMKMIWLIFTHRVIRSNRKKNLEELRKPTKKLPELFACKEYINQ